MGAAGEATSKRAAVAVRAWSGESCEQVTGDKREREHDICHLVS